MIGGIFQAFHLLSWGARLGIIVALFVGVSTISGVAYYKIWSRGYQHALLDIAKPDAQAIARATEFRNAWRQCRDSGMRWDQTTGQCLGR
jgi:hypothetical protein